MKRQPAQLFKFFLLLSILEGIIVTVVLLAIPGDPKNAFLFGYSKSRFALLVMVLLLLAGLTVMLTNQRIRQTLISRSPASSRLQKILPWLGGAFFLLFWLTVWTPAYRLEELAASFTRLQPVLIWLELLLIQLVLYLWLTGSAQSSASGLADKEVIGRIKPLWLASFVLIGLVFQVLTVSPIAFPGSQLYFPPGAPLSALQVLLAWIIFFLLYRLELGGTGKMGKRRALLILAFLGIWVFTFLAWSAAPLACTDDRPGPYPPNNVCYPHVNDAVYSIGSHYITLGQGVYNHWLTDKPLYMAVLALGQAVAGPGIENYLGFQVALVALIPALLFLVGRKTFGSAFGLMLALLTAIQGYYSVSLYRAVGSVNARLENPEVVTALALVGLGFAVFKWLRSPSDLKWAILSGGFLGLAVLLRFNPVFIAPVLLIVILLSARKSWKKLVSPLLLFVLAFTLVFSPWFLSATDRNGRNHYITKIEEVISSRFSQRDGALPDAASNPAELDTANDAESDQPELLTYDLGSIDKAGPEGIVFHFLNNFYTGLAKLPTTLLFYPISDQVSQGIWDFTSAEPLWKKYLGAENLLSLAISLALVLAGIRMATQRFGLAGWTGVLIQAGYYLGNAVSQTSGGRYLEPVHWITLIYYSLGLFAFTGLLLQVFTRRVAGTEKPANDLPQQERLRVADISAGRRTVITLLGACLVAGLVLPALNLLPARLPQENAAVVEQKAFEVLSAQGVVDAASWEVFLSDPQHVLVQGVAYHPRYYRGDFYRQGNLSFELMLLARDHVFIGYSPRMEPREQFSDGSAVFLVGCRLRRDALWSAQRVIAEANAIIQLDHEGNVLVDPQADWSCSR